MITRYTRSSVPPTKRRKTGNPVSKKIKCYRFLAFTEKTWNAGTHENNRE